MGDANIRRSTMATVIGSNSSDNIGDGWLDGFWLSASDTIYGLAGDDWIYAHGGHDLIFGGAGADRLDGGSGIDTASYTDSSERVWVNLTSGLGSYGTAEGDVLVNIENVTGSAYGDYLIGNGVANTLRGMQGQDLMYGGGGADTLYGGDAIDSLYGESGADTLYGELGNDYLFGGSGADILDGGAGSDTAAYSNSNSGVVVLLYTGTASGGDAQGDQLNSIESLSGSSYDDHLWGNDDANVLWGHTGNDWLKGFDGNDELHGGNGNDTLYADAGADSLIGNPGADTMGGGAGGDHFIFYSPYDTGPMGADYIVDFNYVEGDKIDLSRIDPNTGDQAFDFIGNDVAYTGTAGELRFNFGSLEGDLDGDASSDFWMTVNSGPLSDEAFIL
jgi:Ca2+-binding RTX toxin-like protein